MKPNTKSPMAIKAINDIRLDCKRWRRLVSQCAKTEELISSDTEAQYKVVHGRILATCRNLIDENSLPASHRRLALELEELLRPWSSTKSLTAASPTLVNDLVNNQSKIEAELRGTKRNEGVRRFRNLLATACVAAVIGVSMVVIMQWSSSDPTSLLFRSFNGVMTSLATYLGQTTFTEQFAIAVLFSWLFGTWLLSRLSSS
jgi:hypothetical protein